LTSVKYYRGQNTLSYDIYKVNSATAGTYMSGTNPKVIYQNGQSAD